MTQYTQRNEKMPGLGRGGPMSHRRFDIREKPKNTKGTVRRLLSLLLGWHRPLALSVLLTAVSSGASILVPLFVGRAINTFNIKTGTVETTRLLTILLVVAVCYVTSWVVDTINNVLLAHVTQGLVRHLRTELFQKLQKLPLNFFDIRSHGDTMSRMTNDVDTISSTVAQAITQLASGLLTITGTLIVMLTQSVLMTGVALVAVPLFFILSRTIGAKSKTHFIGQQRSLGALNGLIEESITGLKMVKAFNRQAQLGAEFREINDTLRDTSSKAQIWAGFMMPFMNVINNLCFGLVATAGGILAVDGKITLGLVVSFLTYSKQFGMPLNNLAGMFTNIQSALAGAERVFEVLDETQETADMPAAAALEQVSGRVEFKEVSFSYVPGKPVLKNISLTVAPGEVVALVGETGAGKTTMVNLLTRFYELDSGQILIDGVDIRSFPRGALRDCFSVVLQETFLFSGTILENIRLSKPQATDEEVRAACRLCHADAFIDRLPQGYHTQVSGSGDSLSLGQRQLLAIARAILCDAPIMILDEATSSVDTKTEKDIQRALTTLMKNRTSFLIAHRLSTIRDADKIFVLGEGEILESGTHKALMEKKGAYHTLVVSQLGVELGA